MIEGAHYFRFVVGDIGIYEAVDRDCPRSDLRRTMKPDGAWLPRVGEKYPGAVSFWTKFGLEKYLNSGLQEWHRSVAGEPVSVLVAESVGSNLYEDEYQVICQGDHKVSQCSWEQFAREYTAYPLVEKVVAYITRSQGDELLVFEHDKNWNEAGIQVPAGTVDRGEDVEAAVIREAEEECGLTGLRLVRKVDEYVMYRNTHQQFNRRHVFKLEAPPGARDTWTHKVAGDGIDEGMNFHFYWMPFREAEYKLAGSQGASIRKLGKNR